MAGFDDIYTSQWYVFYVKDKEGNISVPKEIYYEYRPIEYYADFYITNCPAKQTYYLSGKRNDWLNFGYSWSSNNPNMKEEEIFKFKNLKSSDISIVKVTTKKNYQGNDKPFITTLKAGTVTISGDLYCENYPDIYKGSQHFSTQVTVVDDTKPVKKTVVGKPNVSLKKSGKKVTVKWKKAKNAKKYKVEWSTNKSMKKAKSKILSSKKLSLKFNKSNKKKKYYVRVTAINGNTKVKSKVKKI